MKQEMIEWQWRELDHMQIICISLVTIFSYMRVTQLDSLLDICYLRQCYGTI